MSTPAISAPAWATAVGGRAAALAVQHWPLALVLYVPSVLLALLAATPVAVGSTTLARHGPWVSRLANGGSLNVLLELGTAAATAPPADPDLAYAGLALPLTFLLALGGVLLQGLAYAILSGGILERLGGRAGPFRTACWRWAWPMLRFSILVVPVFAVLGGAGVALLLALPVREPALTSLVWVASALWLAFVDGALEFGRASLVAHGDRRAVKGLWRLLRLPGQPDLLARASLLWLLLAAASVVYWGAAAGALVLVPASALVLAIVSQQALAFLSAWLTLWRLAVAMELALTTRP